MIVAEKLSGQTVAKDSLYDNIGWRHLSMN